jgi:hypothetical protein
MMQEEWGEGDGSEACELPDRIAVSYDLATLTGRELRRLITLSLHPRLRNPAAFQAWLGVMAALSILLVGLLCAVLLLLAPGITAPSIVAVLLYLSLFIAGSLASRFRLAMSLRSEGLLTVEVSPAGLARRVRWKSSTVAWPAVTGIVATRQDLLFHFASDEFFWMPRRAFSSPELEERFLGAARAWHETAKRVPELDPDLA